MVVKSGEVDGVRWEFMGGLGRGQVGGVKGGRERRVCGSRARRVGWSSRGLIRSSSGVGGVGVGDVNQRGSGRSSRKS